MRSQRAEADVERGYSGAQEVQPESEDLITVCDVQEV